MLEVGDAEIVGYAYGVIDSPMVVVFCHGIPGGPRIPGDRGYAELAELFSSRGLSALFFNFRGVGESGGSFSFSGWCQDLEAVIEYAASDLAPRVVLVGFSGGAVVSAKVAAVDRLGAIDKVVLAACPAGFSDRKYAKALAEVIKQSHEMGALKAIGYRTEDEMVEDIELHDPLRWVGRIEGKPVLIIHGACDELVPLECAHALFRAANQPKRLEIVPKAPHKLRLSREAVETIYEWVVSQAKPSSVSLGRCRACWLSP